MSKECNVIENLWGYESCQLYEDHKQSQELEVAIMEKRENIPEYFLKNLINSMPNRVFQVSQKNSDASSN